MKQITYKYKSKAAAITWGLFLGGFGAHRFYLGNPMVGMLFIVLAFSLPIMSLAATAALVILCIMDLIWIALQDKEYFKREAGYTEVQP